MTQRYEDWPKRFDAALENRMLAPWKWGAHDCMMFGSYMVRAITGADFARGLRVYKSARGATALIKSKGGFVEMIDESFARYNIEQCGSAFASRGDMVIVEHITDRAFGGMAVGVVGSSGRHIAVASVKGWIWLSIDTVLHAWKID